MPKQTFLVSILIICLFFNLKPQTCYSQTWEVNLLKTINPNPPSSKVWKGLSVTAEPLSVGVPIVLFAAGLFEKNTTLKEQSFEMIGGLALATIVTEGLKAAVNRQRPYQKYADIYPDQYENGASFPSGHTSVAFSTATSLALQYKKWYVAVPAYLWASGVAYSRLYLGQHYPSDVFASILIGSGSALLSKKVATLLQRKNHNMKKA